MTKHTKEPWNRGDWKTNAIGTKEASAVITDDGEIDFLIQHENPDTEAALCERVATCINALAGIEDPAATLEAVRELIEKAHGDDHLNHPLVANCDGFDQWKATRELLREALALLKGEA